MLPSDRGNRVVILNLLAGNFIPCWTLRVVVKGVEAVEVANDACFSSSVEGGTCELLDALIF